MFQQQKMSFTDEFKNFKNNSIIERKITVHTNYVITVATISIKNNETVSILNNNKALFFQQQKNSFTAD